MTSVDSFHLSSTEHAYTDPTRQALAFGKRTIPKLIEEANAENESLKLKALHALTWKLHDALDVAEALSCPKSIVRVIKKCLNSPTVLNREKAAEIMALITRHTSGKAEFLAQGSLTSVMDLCEDPSVTVRKFIFQTLENLTQTQTFVRQLFKIKPDLLLHFTSQLAVQSQTDFQLTAQVLTCLCYLLKYKDVMVLKPHLPLLFTNLTNLLQKRVGGRLVRKRLGHCLSELCQLSLEDSELTHSLIMVVPLIVQHIDDPHVEVRIEMLSVVMALGVHTQRKLELVDHGIVPKLVQILVEDHHLESIVNVLKAISCISEDYRARYTFQNEALSKIEKYTFHSHPLISSCAKQTYEVVTWRP